MGHPVFEVGPAERDGGGEDRDLEHDVIEPMTRERGVWPLHRFILQVVAPSFLSSSSMPMAASSSRRRSASLKFLALRAALRASTISSIFLVSSASDSLNGSKSTFRFAPTTGLMPILLKFSVSS